MIKCGLAAPSMARSRRGLLCELKNGMGAQKWAAKSRMGVFIPRHVVRMPREWRDKTKPTLPRISRQAKGLWTVSPGSILLAKIRQVFLQTPQRPDCGRHSHPHAHARPVETNQMDKLGNRPPICYQALTLYRAFPLQSRFQS